MNATVTAANHHDNEKTAAETRRTARRTETGTWTMILVIGATTAGARSAWVRGAEKSDMTTTYLGIARGTGIGARIAIKIVNGIV